MVPNDTDFKILPFKQNFTDGTSNEIVMNQVIFSTMAPRNPLSL